MKSVKINGITYSNVPIVEIPLAAGGGNAVFPETSDASAVADDISSGKTAYVNGVKVTGVLDLNISTTTPTNITGVLYGNGSTVSGKSFGGASGVSTLDSDSKLTPSQITTKDVEVTSSISLGTAHNNRRLKCTNSSAITVTIQTQASGGYADEHETEISSEGTGQVTIALASGVQVRAVEPTNLKIMVGGTAVIKRSADNVWKLDGTLEA